MQLNLKKLPTGVKGIAQAMEMGQCELMHWGHYKEVRDIFIDFNFGVLTKDQLIQKMLRISEQCAIESQYHYSVGIDNAIAMIKYV